MAPLAHTLALLAMTVATAASEMKLLDTAQDCFDDQYRGCGPAMTADLQALMHSDFEKNPVLAEVWSQALSLRESLGSPVSPLSSRDQATAITAFSIPDIYRDFNAAVRVAGRSPQEYRDNFHYKTLHFLLTDALATLRDTQKGQCLDVVSRDCDVQYKAQRGDTVRFGEFRTMFLNDTRECPGQETFFQVQTCHGAEIQFFTTHQQVKMVLIPPFETFQVSEVTQEGNQTQIQLHSTGTFSKYNCEWLKGGSIPRAPFHLGGLLLATTALAVATRIL